MSRKPTVRNYLDGHIGDLILTFVVIMTLIAYTITILMGKPDQTLGNVLMASTGALGGFMMKRLPPAQPTTNVETANVEGDMNMPKETTQPLAQQEQQ